MNEHTCNDFAPNTCTYLEKKLKAIWDLEDQTSTTLCKMIRADLRAEERKYDGPYKNKKK